MPEISADQLEGWAAQVDNAASWSSGARAGKLQALATEIRTAGGLTAPAESTVFSTVAGETVPPQGAVELDKAGAPAAEPTPTQKSAQRVAEATGQPPQVKP